MGHLPLELITLSSQLRVATVYLDTGLTINQEAGGKGQVNGKSDKAMQSKTMRAKLYNNGTTMHVHGNHPLANSRFPSLPFTP